MKPSLSKNKISRGHANSLKRLLFILGIKSAKPSGLTFMNMTIHKPGAY